MHFEIDIKFFVKSFLCFLIVRNLLHFLMLKLESLEDSGAIKIMTLIRPIGLEDLLKVETVSQS